MYLYNKKLLKNSQELRKNMTPEEKHLWYDFLKRLPISVKRQVIIENYIVDFYIPSRKIVIELDGIQHEMSEHKERDYLRDEKLAEHGIVVLRYPNSRVKYSLHLVAEDILEKIGLSIADLK